MHDNTNGPSLYAHFNFTRHPDLLSDPFSGDVMVHGLPANIAVRHSGVQTAWGCPKEYSLLHECNPI